MKLFLRLILALGLVAIAACESSSDSRSGVNLNGTDDSGSTNDTASSGDTDTDTDSDTDSDSDTDTEEPIQLVCPDGEDHPDTCYCLRMGVIGTFDSKASKNDVTAFVDWLNTKSNAIVTMVKTKPVITADFLNSYDILLFLNQSDGVSGPFWSYGADESAALKSWLEAGGGMITVTGFNGDMTAQEVGAMNTILEPATGMSYNNDKYLAEPDLPQNNYCWENSVPIEGWNPDHDISREIKRIAAFWGSSINAPDNAVVVATQPSQTGITDNAVVSVEIGKGRAVAIADEWPLFTNVWLPGTNQQIDANPYDPCYDTDAEQWNYADVYFQHPQFWYNTIEWTAPENECFTIDEPIIITID